MNLNRTAIFEALKRYDFTEYEAKMYIALLQKHPANGNEIAIASGVPSPKVYENLKKMVEKEVVFPVTDGKQAGKRFYTPLPYEDLLSKFEYEVKKDSALLSNYFKELERKTKPDWSELYHIDGYSSSLESLKELIDGAEQSIYISCWGEEMDQLYENLVGAHKRSVNIASISFSKSASPIPWLHFLHHEGKYSNKRHIGELSCVIDERRVLILHSTGDEAHSVVSSHAALTRSTLNYIRHDIYINRVASDLGAELKAFYGSQFEKLLDDF